MLDRKELKLALLGVAMMSLGIGMGVAWNLPSRQETYTPIAVLPQGDSKHRVILEYRLRNGRGLSVHVRTYSDASATYTATPSRYCDERMDLWERDGPDVQVHSATAVQNLLKRRSQDPPPACPKP